MTEEVKKCIDCNTSLNVTLRKCPYTEIILNEDKYEYLCPKCLDIRYNDTVVKKTES